MQQNNKGAKIDHCGTANLIYVFQIYIYDYRKQQIVFFLRNNSISIVKLIPKYHNIVISVGV